jgi:hypothetical protein
MYQTQLEVWFVKGRAKVKNSRTEHLKRKTAGSNQQPCNCRYTPRATAGILNLKTIF